MSRIYMIYIRPIGDPNREWEFFNARNGYTARLYTKPPSKASIQNATTNYRGDKIRDYRVVYFETEDLLDHTDDDELAYQQAEVVALRAGERAEVARSIAKNPAPRVAPEPKIKKKRVYKKKPAPVPAPAVSEKPYDYPLSDGW